jgi:hypothetical protein
MALKKRRSRARRLIRDTWREGLGRLLSHFARGSAPVTEEPKTYSRRNRPNSWGENSDLKAEIAARRRR